MQVEDSKFLLMINLEYLSIKLVNNVSKTLQPKNHKSDSF